VTSLAGRAIDERPTERSRHAITSIGSRTSTGGLTREGYQFRRNTSWTIRLENACQIVTEGMWLCR
jgi:hypothetical protein